jgi:hypothetical protein
VPSGVSQNFIIYYTVEAAVFHPKAALPVKLEFEIELDNPAELLDYLGLLHNA